MSVSCPSCHADMQVMTFAGKLGAAIDLDVCHACRLIWFDQHESTMLSPASVLALFEAIQTDTTEVSRPAQDHLGCVRCNEALLPTHDMVRTNRFMYHRCPAGHGRLISFWHFLREKQFVRDLSLAERRQLAAAVAQTRCGACGAMVDVRNEDACSYCRAPIAAMDKRAISDAINAYHAGTMPGSVDVAATPNPAPIDLEAMKLTYGESIVSRPQYQAGTGLIALLAEGVIELLSD
ncbi:MAG: zf-TFIIB domain-containing protein [Burkholderiales bacterium]|nr:zf-TFIIB domain-containing protein [Burkholderiales bacterium]